MAEKETTTVGFDYGELTIPGQNRMRLYGTPGQERFTFMRDIRNSAARDSAAGR